MLAYKDRPIMEDYPSEVYFNLHKKVFSMKQDGLVVLHSEVIILSDCIFKVSEAGRQRVLEEQRKNVHARVFGYFVKAEANMSFETLEQHRYRRAYYNPYKVSTFVDWETNEPLHEAAKVVLKNKQIYYKN